MTPRNKIRHKGTLVSAACALFLLAESPLAAPKILELSGNLEHKATATILGEGFGVKPTAAPVRWDDFERGTVGQNLSGWDINSTKSAYRPKYALVGRPGTAGSMSAHQHFNDSNYNSTIAVYGISSRKFYVSGWVSGNTSGPASRNVKLFSMRGGAAGDLGNPESRLDQYPHNGSGQKYITGCGGGKAAGDWTMKGELVISDGKWHRVEMWVDLGTPNGGDGRYTMWKDGKEWGETLSGTFITSNCSFNNVFIQHYYATDNADGISANYYWDELYVDTTPARVELGNAAEWRNVTHREIQVPSKWNSGSIAFTVNRGAFQEGDKAYLYVVDEKGNANAVGYPVTVGAGAADEAPAVAPTAPTDLVVK